MLSVDRVLTINWENLPTGLKESLKDRYSYKWASSVYIPLLTSVPSYTLLRTDEDIINFLCVEHDMSVEDVEEHGLMNILDEESDGDVLRVLRLNPGFYKEFDSIQLYTGA